MKTLKTKSKKKIYFLTSATTPDFNIPFVDSALVALEFYKKKGYEPKLLIPETKSYRKNCGFIEEIDHLIVKQSMNLANNLRLEIINQNDMNPNPIAGIDQDYSVIVPGINHAFTTLPRQIKVSKLPKIVCSTGSVNNSPAPLMRTKGELKSISTFITGGLFVEVSADGSEFHIRQVEWCEVTGGFYDLDMLFTPKKAIKYVDNKSLPKAQRSASAIIHGDDHPDDLCLATYAGQGDLLMQTKAKDSISHDWLSFHNSGSHHAIGKYISQTKCKLTVEEEIKLVAKHYYEKAKKYRFTKIHLVASNHSPDHINKWLDEGRWLTGNVADRRIGAWLCHLYFEGKNVLKEAFNKYYPMDNVHFLERDEKLTIHSWELSNHGDAAANGGRNMGPNFRNQIVGHTHSPKINAFGGTTVGTSSSLSPDYCNDSGTSSWLNTDCLIYPNGKRTLIHYINGKYRA